MPIRLSFHPQKRNEPPQMIVQKPAQTERKIANIYLLNQQIKNQFQNEQDSLQQKKVTELLKELDNLIGLDTVKKLIYELQAFLQIQRKREKENLQTDIPVLHMIFKGSPGTGKTTVARIIGNLFKEMGLLRKGHVIEVERADLVGEYIGHTALKTREQIKQALGGVLFIDEAYSLARGGERDFGKEAIDTLVKAIEDYKDNLILILAGYSEEMNEFLEANPGLYSRFPLHIDFPNYTVEELLAIAEQMLKKREYQLTEEARNELERILISKKTLSAPEHNGNARLVRNIIERAIRRQAVRLVNQTNLSRNDLLLITWQDLHQCNESV
jgi:stage V sporulation protein K